MESQDNPCSTSSLSASNQFVDQQHHDLDFRVSCHDSLSCSSQPKIQLPEFMRDKTIVETHYDTIKKQWDYVKALRSRGDVYRDDVVSSRKSSALSISSLNLKSSEPSIIRDDEQVLEYDENNLYVERNDDAHEDQSQVQIVMTPRSATKESKSQDDVNRLNKDDVNVVKSLESVVTRRSRKTVKRKRASNTAAAKKINEESIRLSTLYNAKPKKKKQTGRLKNSNSKSTVMTRDAVLDKKPERRKLRRQRSLETVSGTTVARSLQIRKRPGLSKSNRGETSSLQSGGSNTHHRGLVKLYQNRKALKSGSLATVSSGPGIKVEQQTDVDYLDNYDDDEDTITNHAFGDNAGRKNLPITEERIEADDDTIIDIPEEVEYQEQEPSRNAVCCQANEEEEEQSAAYPQNYYDAFQQRNYEMPTEASKMKQVHRPHYGFNIRGIPFVVGTSLSPSHNLGLNIQQVLNVIKMKKPQTLGINPMLIRKCSKGLSPVSLLLNELSHECMRSCQTWHYQDNYEQRNNNNNHNNNISSHSCGHLQNSFPTSFANQTGFKQCNVTCEPLYEEDEESRSICSESRADYQQILRDKQHHHSVQEDLSNNMDYINNRLKQRLPASHMTKQFDRRLIEINFSSPTPAAAAATAGTIDENSQKCPKSNKEMMDIFNRLYEQFDKMIMQHEKLKEQLEKRKDNKALLKEMSELESAMSAKEQEIAAVVSLYTEVMSLRQQMRMLRERNSLACLASQDPGLRQSLLTRRAHTALPYENGEANYCRRNQLCGPAAAAHRGQSVTVCHEPPHSLRLTSLLRQIRAFYRQLSLV